MSRPAVAPRCNADREAAILSVAWQVFLKEGYVGASMGEICDRVGGSKATLYSYFPTKQVLFLAVIQQQGDLLYAELGRLPHQWDDLAGGLVQFGRRLLGIVLSESYLALQRLIIAEGGRFPVLSDTGYDARRDTLVGPLSVRLKEEMDAGRLIQADPMETAEIFWNLCSASIYRRALTAQGATFTTREIDRQVGRAVEVFFAAYDASFGGLRQTSDAGPAIARGG